MSCAATPLTVWLVLALLVVVAAGWGALELVMWKRAMLARHRAEMRAWVDVANMAMGAYLKQCERAVKS